MIPVTACGHVPPSESRLSLKSEHRTATQQRQSASDSPRTLGCACGSGVARGWCRTRRRGNWTCARSTRYCGPRGGPPHTEQAAENVCMEGCERPHPLAACPARSNGCTPCCAFASSQPAMGAQRCHREGRGLVTHTAHSGSVRGRFQPPALKDSITTAHGCHPYAF